MSDKSYLDWPFFEEGHRQLQAELERWIAENVTAHHGLSLIHISEPTRPY